MVNGPDLSLTSSVLVVFDVGPATGRAEFCFSSSSQSFAQSDSSPLALDATHCGSFMSLRRVADNGDNVFLDGVCYKVLGSSKSKDGNNPKGLDRFKKISQCNVCSCVTQATAFENIPKVQAT